MLLSGLTCGNNVLVKEYVSIEAPDGPVHLKFTIAEPAGRKPATVIEVGSLRAEPGMRTLRLGVGNTPENPADNLILPPQARDQLVTPVSAELGLVLPQMDLAAIVDDQIHDILVTAAEPTLVE